MDNFCIEIRNQDFSLDVRVSVGDEIEFVDATLDDNDVEVPAGTIGNIVEIDLIEQVVTIEAGEQIIYQTLGSVIEGYRGAKED